MNTFSRYAAITIDYETWHPIPAGHSISWDKDIFTPAQHLSELAIKLDIPLTFMVEMGEYFWLEEYKPKIAEQMKQQLVQLVKDGHELQLHLHPCWLPELGAKHENGEWFWNWELAKAENYPGDLREVIHRCKLTLESIIQKAGKKQNVNCFRAGAYQAQPFQKLSDALIYNNIQFDSSVYSGGVSKERGYDYSLCRHKHQPYYANLKDPQFSVTASKIIELPVTTFQPQVRWMFDGKEAKKIFSRIKRMTGQERDSSFCQFFIMIGHTKGEKHYQDIEKNLEKTQSILGIEFLPLSKLGEKAKINLLKRPHLTKTERSIDQAKKIMASTYNALSPEKEHQSNIPEEILKNGFAWCHGYALVFQWLLEKELFRSRIIHFFMYPHLRGHGEQKIDSHVVIEVFINNKWQLFDPMSNTYYEGKSFHEILRQPDIAKKIREALEPDARYQKREYSLYSSQEAFQLCKRFYIESPLRYWKTKLIRLIKSKK